MSGAGLPGLCGVVRRFRDWRASDRNLTLTFMSTPRRGASKFYPQNKHNQVIINANHISLALPRLKHTRQTRCLKNHGLNFRV